jgi:hypothetical protein
LAITYIEIGHTKEAILQVYADDDVFVLGYDPETKKPQTLFFPAEENSSNKWTSLKEADREIIVPILYKRVLPPAKKSVLEDLVAEIDAGSVYDDFIQKQVIPTFTKNLEPCDVVVYKQSSVKIRNKYWEFVYGIAAVKRGSK